MQDQSPLRTISMAPILIAFAALAYAIYSPALDGDFVSDDAHYVHGNRYLHELSADHLSAILDPTGPLIRIVENYAPVHLLLHALSWQAFGDDVRGHHLVNVSLHALASGLLFVLFRRSGIPHVAALLGAAFFLLHPANVEAIAWISQLKSSAAMVLMLAALLAHPKWPAVALLSFALALLAKPTAAVALFVIVAFGLATDRPRYDAVGDDPAGAAKGWRWRWVALWTIALAGFAVVELQAFGQTAGMHLVQVPELDARLRTMFAVALRYVVMAGGAYGLGAFQEPEPAASWLDGWWLASLFILGGLGWRAASVLRQRRLEGAFWVWAVVSFAPVSGAIPLPHIIADRYLYFMLPGLIGGTLLAGPTLIDRACSLLKRPVPPSLGRTLIVVAVIWIAVFAQRSFARASVWQSEHTLMADIVGHYPEGRWAMVELARRAAERGDASEAVRYVERARARGFSKLDVLLRPRFAKVHGTPSFDALVNDLAQSWIERISAIARPTQSDLMVLAQMHIVRGELDAAQVSLRRAIDSGGPMTDYLYTARDTLAAMQKAAAKEAR